MLTENDTSTLWTTVSYVSISKPLKRYINRTSCTGTLVKIVHMVNCF